MKPSNAFLSPTDLPALLANLDAALSRTHIQVRSSVYASAEDLLALLEARTISDRSLKLLWRTSDLAAFTVRGHAPDPEPPDWPSRVPFLVIRSPSENVYVVLSTTKARPFRDIVLRHFLRLYPKVSRTFLNTGYMLSLLRRLERQHAAADIRVRRMVTKRRLDREAGDSRIESTMTWTFLPYEQAFAQAREDNQWFKSFEFTFHVSTLQRVGLFDEIEDREVAGYMSNSGILACRQGFSVFYRTVVEDLCRKADQDRAFYSNRTREASRNWEPRPIVIAYDEEVFHDRAQNKRLVNIIRKLPYCSVSVLHPNPYLHASLVDYMDGSAYEIWVVSSDKIILVPQLRATYASMSKVVNQILNNFHDGLVRDYERK